MTVTNPIQSLGTSGPVGAEITKFSDYTAAQSAVDALSDAGFPVQKVQIIGTDLRLIENVTGRMTTPKAFVSGLGTGAWFGVMIGLVMFILGSELLPSLLTCVLLGAVWGGGFFALTHFFRRGKRDFTSVTRVVPTNFSLYCAFDAASECRRVLTEKGVLRAAAPPVDLSTPPLYGERIVDSDPGASPS